MAFNKPRIISRRKGERRCKQRRAEAYVFGSPEWVERIKQENMLWPKRDRRCGDRRSRDRRQTNRRLANAARRQTIKYTNLLTEEEKRMLSELMR